MHNHCSQHEGGVFAPNGFPPGPGVFAPNFHFVLWRANRGPKAQAAFKPGPKSASGAPTGAQKRKRRANQGPKAQAAAPKSTSGGDAPTGPQKHKRREPVSKSTSDGSNQEK